MSANEGDEFCPRKHNGYCSQVSVEQHALIIIVEDNHEHQANHGQLNPVFKAGKISFDRNCHLKELSDEDEGQKNNDQC